MSLAEYTPVSDAEAGVPSGHATPRPSALRGTLIALLAVLLAFVVRLAVRPLIDNTSPFLLFTPAVAIAAFYGGLFPAILSTALSAVAGSHFFLNLSGEPILERWDRVALFLVVGAVITAWATVARRSREQIAQSLWREQRARAAAEAADLTKDDFLAAISHELNTPLSVVAGWLASINERQLEGAPLHRALDAVGRNVQVLTRLVEDVLDRSRIGSGKLRLEMRAVTLAGVVRAASDAVRARFDAKGVQLKAALPEDHPPGVMGDPVRLQQIFTNLLTNAVKFTPAGGVCSVRLIQDDTTVTVAVTDTGAGIASDMLPHIFEPYRQGADTLQHSTRGLGLGLAITKHLVERHGGSISAMSAGPGHGATFTVTLPLLEMSTKISTVDAPPVRPETSPRIH